MPTVTLASTNRVQLSIIPEATFGDTPVTGSGRNLRMTGESLDFNLTKENDKEITSDAQLTSSTTVNAAAGGDVKVHLQYAEYDALFAGVMRSSWGVYGTNGVGAPSTIDFTANALTASVAPTGTSAFTTLARGQWFRVNAGGINAGKLLRVSTTVAPTATVITLDPSTPAAVATAVSGVILSSSRLANDVSISSFTLQREVADVGQFFVFRGMYVSKFSTSFASASLTEGTFSFIGKNSTRALASALPGSTAASQTFDIQNAVTGVGNVWENGAPLAGTFIKSMTLDIDSALRAQDAIGNLGMIGAGIGTFMAKGSLELYFADGTMYDKFVNDTYTSISLSTKDADGNGYVFSFPRVQLTGGKIQAGGKDADLMASFEYTAYADRKNAIPALRKTLFIDRFGAAVTV